MKKILIALIISLTFSSNIYADDNNTMSMTDTDGNTYTVRGTDNGLSIDEFQGKVIFLEFFGTRCPACLKGIPHLINLQNKFKDQLVIVSFEVQRHNNATVKAFAQERGINYITIANENAGDVVNYIARRAQWKGAIPFMVALDTKSEVQFVQVGMLPEDSLEQLVKDLSETK